MVRLTREAVVLVSFGFVFVQASRRKLPRMAAVPFAVNLVANLLFMPLFAWLNSRFESEGMAMRSGSGRSSPANPP